MASNFQNLYPQNQQNLPQNNQQIIPQQFQQMQVFPQPVGNVYNLNSSNDIANIPVGPHLSVGLCLNEGVVCIKSLQNGAPATLVYTLKAPKDENEGAAADEISKIYEILDTFKDQLSKINSQLKLKGGKPEWQI